jgi:eukaryotic-like serine/threonine-protein kinase
MSEDGPTTERGGATTDGGVTLHDTLSAGLTGQLAALEGERYEIGDELGRGGMGVVRLARDTRIEREVAIKLMRPEHRAPGTIARFFREARVQGALQHPAIVPIHDLGIDPDGNPYFVMKKLAGVTLAEVLAAPQLPAPWTRQKLLARLVDVCLALELAHTRGIVHRDIKPANIMLGNFGEAYIIDWGVARLLAASEDSVKPRGGGGDGETLAGDLLGTPGYMAPEQARTEPVDGRADVFGLGCVLFEILVGTPAFPRGLPGVVQALGSEECRPSVRAPDADVPLELDELCARATTARREDRLTARQLADGIQAYLDGDRDLERRRALAGEHARRALMALAEPVTDDDRALAMREAGRALALDPTDADAQLVLARLRFQAPETMPTAALAAADADRGLTRQRVLRSGVGLYAISGALMAILFAFPIARLWPIIFAEAFAALAAALAWWMSRRPLPMRSPWFVVLLGANSALLAATGLLFGPLLVMPMFIFGSLATFLIQPNGYPPSWTVIAHALPLAVLLGLEWLGVLPPTFRIANGALVLTAPVVALTPSITAFVIGISVLAQFLNTIAAALAGRAVQERTQDLVHAQKWHLDQLLPRR